jgi:hypothetical protein
MRLSASLRRPDLPWALFREAIHGWRARSMRASEPYLRLTRTWRPRRHSLAQASLHKFAKTDYNRSGWRLEQSANGAELVKLFGGR